MSSMPPAERGGGSLKVHLGRDLADAIPPRDGSAAVVMVCGGGGAKAAAHIGALQALEEAGLSPGQFLGTSMGAVFATLFASGLGARAALERVASIDEREIVQTETFAFLKGLWARSLLKPLPLRRSLERMLGTRRFEDLKLPLTVTATDFDSGELVLFGAGGRSAPLIDVLWASCALPLFFPPVTIDGRRYCDGGLRSVLPLEAASIIPARLVVAVDVGPGFDELAGEGLPTGLPPVVETHNQAMTILMSEQTRAALAFWRQNPNRPPLLYVRPRVEKGATFRVDQVRRYVEEGYAATRAALAGLKSGAG
ncbi:MAG TPA: patatin-like phospholipase family protein [Gemmatimonadales bacterium]|nr:patatin-like phospholipase family protein [Gemmatimonadales bacterium]